MQYKVLYTSDIHGNIIQYRKVVKYAKRISEIVSEVNKLSSEEQEKEFKELGKEVSERETREGLPELPNVPKTGVVMRFAPSASGPLHIGHAMTACVSFLYVKKFISNHILD